MIKFIIIGVPRSGTTVISGSVITHPDLLFYGELFNSMMDVRANEASRITLGAGWKFEKALGWGIKPCSDAVSTYDYLNDFFSREIPFKATGFKLLFDQAIEGPNSDIWKYIAEHSDIKIIRTQRENLIEIVCSYVRASITRRWHTADTATGNPRFIVPPVECQALFERFSYIPESARQIDNSHQILDLQYSVICSDFQECMSRLYSFLGVDSDVKETPKLKKIARVEPPEELVNYQELKEYFQGTQYSKHFIY